MKLAEEIVDLKPVFEDGNIWLSQKGLAKLFSTTTQNVTIHIANISKYLKMDDVSKYIQINQREGKRLISRKVRHYNYDVLFNIAVRGQYFHELNSINYFMKEKGTAISTIKTVPINETNFGNTLHIIFDGILDIYEQYKCGKYYIDFYIPELNIAIEYDEHHHKYQSRKDVQREKWISEQLGVTFIRVSEFDDLSGLNTILKHLIKITGWKESIKNKKAPSDG
jgi:very-short-patch-repair endonuclease